MMIVGASTLAVKLVGMLKDVVVAAHFGTSNAIDAMFVAIAIPTFLTNVVAGSLPSAVVPVYVRVREQEGVDAARQLASNIVGGAIIVALLASLLLLLLTPVAVGLVGSGFSADKLALARTLFVLLVPAIVVSGIANVLSAVLNADERFFLGAMTPALVGLMPILFVLAFVDRWGIYALGIGLVVGYLSEVVVLAWSVRRRRFMRMPSFRAWHPATREVVREYVPMALGMIVMSSTPLIDQAMAATLGPGSVSALTYGSKLVAAGVSIGVTGLSTALFPHFSKMVANNDWAAVRTTLRTYVRLILAVTIPVVLLFVVFSDSIVQVVFQRGAFSGADTAVVARVQALFAVQIPFYVLGILGVRLLSATGGNRLLMWISIGNFFTNILGNYVFMHLWGVAGIAFSTSVVYMISAIVIYFGVRHRLNHGVRSI